MSKKIFSLLLGLVLLCGIAACGKAENTNTAGNDALPSITAQVSGSFTATVRDVIPDYCMDGTGK